MTYNICKVTLVLKQDQSHFKIQIWEGTKKDNSYHLVKTGVKSRLKNTNIRKVFVSELSTTLLFYTYCHLHDLIIVKEEVVIEANKYLDVKLKKLLTYHATLNTSSLKEHYE